MTQSMTVRDVWLPENGPRAVLLRWMMSEWCNYRCAYCPQTHDRHHPKGNGMTAHAFDNYPLEKWLDAFDRHFSDAPISMVFTGGETMLDRPNMTKLLNHLSAKDSVECIRLDTNLWWRPDHFPELVKSKLILMCTFHPSQTDEEKFVERVELLKVAGYRIGMINYVMDSDNLDKFKDRKRRFKEMGLVLHPNPLWGGGGLYSNDDLGIMKSSIPPMDFSYRASVLNPRGKDCLFPAIGYEMDIAGTISTGCHGSLRGSFFDEKLPDRFVDKVPCPKSSCHCLDKYSFMEGCDRNVSFNPLAEYSKALSEIH